MKLKGDPYPFRKFWPVVVFVLIVVFPFEAWRLWKRNR